MVSISAENNTSNYPLLPLRDVVVYPHMVVPLFVGREKSILALEHAMENDKQIILVAQKNPSEDDPLLDDIYKVGTFATILQMLKLPDGTLKVLVEGLNRVELLDGFEDQSFMRASLKVLESEDPQVDESDALMRSTISLFEQYHFF